MRSKNFLLLFILMCYSIFGNTLIPNSPNLIHGKLENGLEYYIYKNKKPENRASLNLMVKSGSLLERDDQQGLAHFLEHMAFNGTEKYKKNDLVKYLQSIGLKFGGDLNAYTSFNETVYQLQVPTTEKDLDIAFEIFNQWASKVTLEPTSIESEKNIIIEEWRLRQGITKRIGDLQKKMLFGNSWYSQRFPIGKTDIIRNANHKLLEDYYKKWYQPQNMVVLAVGDFDPQKVKSLIYKNFSGLKNDWKMNKPTFPIGLDSKSSAIVFTDKELTRTNVDLMWKEPISPINSKESFKLLLTKSLLNSILQSRFNTETKSVKSPFSSAGMYNFPLDSKIGIYGVSISVKDAKVKESLESIINSLKEVSQLGVTNSELENEKLNYINTLKMMVENKKSINSETYIESLRELVTQGDSFIDPDTELKISTEVLKSITNDDIKKVASNLLKTKYNLLVTSRENLKYTLPSANELKSFLDNIILSKKTYTQLDENSSKLNYSPQKQGTIKNKSNSNNITKFTLSNGLKVSYKKTTFDKDKVYIKLTKLQGSSSLDYTHYINSIFLPGVLVESGAGNIDYKQVEQYFKGKNFQVSPYVGDYTQGFIISCDRKNLEEGLKYFRSMVEHPNFSDEVIASTLETSKESIKNRNFSPKAMFSKTVVGTLTSNNKRRMPLELNDLQYVSSKNLKETFNQLFNNFADYNITIVGSIDENTTENILKKYFANLPTTGTNLKRRDLNIKYPTHSISKKVVQGIDKKTSVVLIYPYKGKVTLDNRVLFNSLASLLDILLIEDVREDIGGVYSISASSNLEFLNFGENYLKIGFSTDTKRTREVINKVKEVVIKAQNGNYRENKIEDIKKNYQLNYETALKTNELWLTYLDKKNIFPNYKLYSPTMYNQIVTYNSLTNFAKSCIDPNDVIEVILEPEKEE